MTPRPALRPGIRAVLGCCIIVAITATLATAVARPATATTTSATTVELVPVGESVLEVGGRMYAGRLTITNRADGLSLVETVDLRSYLGGLREVPFSWDDQALAAQAVAARTYLANGVAGGRNGSEATYGYDICASGCQAYRGTGIDGLRGGERWLAAIDETEGEILLHGGRPIQAVFSASAGSRTRANQDIWGSSPIPYLQPVDSPEEGVSPWATWRVEIPPGAVVAILEADGRDVGGALESIEIRSPGEGRGSEMVWVSTEEGTVSMTARQFKGVVSHLGPELYPGLLPGPTSSGSGRLPEAILSYTYSVALERERSPHPRLRRLLPEADLPHPDRIAIEGEGWGHGVGMSQWGAQAMALGGSGYADILSHYYGGLQPQVSESFVPEAVTVGLRWRRAEIEVKATGPFVVSLNGVPAGTFESGEWTFRTGRDGVRIVPPDLVAKVLDRPWPR